MTLTYEAAREWFSYDSETGVISWIAGARKGREAGKHRRDGYIQISCCRRLYLAHRVAFLLMQGEWPPGLIDHINGIESDNRWVNLRSATAKKNNQNLRRPSRKNKSGFLGVCSMKGKWRATLTLAGKQIWLGLFDTPQEAYEAYVAGKRKFHEGCTL